MAEKMAPVNNKLSKEGNTGLGQEDQTDLTTELHGMRRRPFGIGVDGQPIAESNGKIVATGIQYMQELVGKHATQNAPSDATPDQIAALVSQAQSNALDRLVSMLNAAIPDERYYITREYLLNESNNYTYEFDLFVAEYCRVISGNPNFHFEVGTRSIPASIAALLRPLGLQRTYSLLPVYTAKFIRTDIRVIDLTPTSVRVQWYANKQLEHIPEEHRLPYVRYACKRFQGAYAVIPSRIFNGQMAQVKEISCQANGDPCCEWEFTWQPSKKDSSGIPLLLGTIFVVSLLAYMLFGLSSQTWLALLVVSILSFVAWLWIEIRRLRGVLDQRTALLQEQRDLSEEEYDKSERARSELQQVNIALTNRVEELTMLQKVGEALGRTTDLNELLDKSLETVISSLHFDRALLMLIDEKRRVLTGTRTIGGDPQVSARAAQLEFPLDDLKYDLVKLAHADEPQHYRNVDQQGDEENKAIARGLGVTEWLGTPLIAKGRRVGVVGVDNGVSQRPLASENLSLLFTVGTQIAAAIDSAQLYRTLERRVEERTAALEQRNAELGIINAVQSSLAARLDIHGIYESVGEKLREIFNVQTISIYSADVKTRIFTCEYGFEKGRRLETVSVPFNSLFEYLILLNDTFVLNGNFPQFAAQFTDYRTPRGEMPRSIVAVPVIKKKDADSVVFLTLQDIDGEKTFSDSDVRLLETLANSMSVALENARLFDEVQKRNQEISEALEQQTATSEVLRAMSGFQPDLRSLLEIIAVNVAKVCGADDAHVYRIEGETLKEWTHRGPIPGLEAGESLPLNRSSVIGRSIVERQIIHIRDAAVELDETEYPVSVPLQRRWAYRTVLATPLLRDGEPIGGIAIRRKEVQPFTEKQIELVKTFADQAVIAIENVRLFEETQRLLKETEQRAAELAIINSVQEGLASRLEIQAIYDLVGDKIRDVFDAQVVTISTFDTDNQRGALWYGIEKGKRFYDDPSPLTEGHRRFIQARQPLLISENWEKRMRDFGYLVNVVPGTEKPKSTVFVPLIANNEVKGSVSLQNVDRENAFSEADIRLLTTLANSMSVALENARLFDETQRLLKQTEQRAAELATINTVSNALAGELDLSALIELVGEQIRNIFNADIAYVALLDEETNTINFPYTYGEELTPIAYGDGLTSKIIETGKPLLINQDIDKRRKELGARQVGIQARSYLGVPIFLSGKAIGAVSVQSTTQEGVFMESDARLLGTIAANVGVAFQNARLFDEIQSRNREITESLEQQTATSEILRVIASSPTDIQPVLDVIAQNARKLCGASQSAVYRKDGKLVHEMAVSDLSADMLEATQELSLESYPVPLERNSTLSARAIIDGTVVHVPDMENEPDLPEVTQRYVIAQTIKSALFVPMVREGEAIGCIGVGKREPVPFTDQQIALLQTFASQAVIAIENVRLFNEVTRRKEYFEALFQNNPVAVVTIDNDATVTSWNPAAEKLFGYAREEAVGQNVDTLVAKTEEIYADAVHYSRIGLDAGSDAFQVIVKRTRKDGSIVDVELSAVPIIVQGERQGIYALYHDITELQRARQEAIAANEAKSAFLATMSHEIRTPMNAVIGMSGLLMDTELNKEQRDYAETIRSSGDALLAIINDILDFSKIEAGKMDVEHQPFDLRECVESALDLTAAHAIEKGLDIAYLIDDDVPAGIKSDVTRLRQILINLLSNAIKFTEKGEVVLTVKNGKSKNELLFTVRDTGIGISKGHLNRLFQSFSQADSSTTRRFGGTGLGLAISKRLTEMMGGEMHAESEGDGKGSIFVFTIRAEPAKVPERKVERDVRSIQSILQGKHVLIVDDNPTNRRILTLQTEKWGMIPRETQSPNQALEWVKDGERFDLAILDLQMPEIDGVMLAREIRRLRNEASLPIILLTSLGRREVGAEDLKFAAYLTKPLKPSHLYDALARVFARNVISPKEDAARHVVDADLGKRYPLRILLAEDNAVNQKLALRLLEQMGYRADVASNGIEAVESIERQTYDVILMDVQMPDMDGLDATREIRKLINAIQPRIIAMTANAMEGDREMCLAAGMDDYISKPIRVNELVEALMKAERRQ